METDAATVAASFQEELCNVGGARCPAWDEWFQACEDTDPDAIAEERDPAPLSQWPFNPLACERPDICRLYRLAVRRELEGNGK